ncbi:MAG: NAD-dependent deacylase [Chloroflexota bacterium]
MLTSKLIDQAARLFSESSYPIALTGAGISTPSGIPDFRSTKDGLWEKFNPMEVASLSAFRVRPEKFFEWFRPLTKTIIEAQPNPAHSALAEMAGIGKLNEIITQNIDGLHQKAGSKDVLEVHGTLNSLTCVSCYTTHNTDQFVEGFIQDGLIPHCTKCGSILKPDAILFEEQLPRRTWVAVEEAVRNCDLMLVAGSSLEVFPVARLPYDAITHGAKLIVVNNEPTYIDPRAEIVINLDVAEALPAIMDQMNK